MKSLSCGCMNKRPTLVIGEQAFVVAGIGDPGRVCAPDHKFQLVGITDARYR
jgi:hypothetical protein